MDLTLTVIEAPQDVNMINHTKAFKGEGGSLGRADRNTWVLPCNERIVSSTHAEIFFKDGAFFLSDVSTNGTYHNDDESPIGEGDPTKLESGDTLKIGNYKIKVSVKQENKPLPKGLETADFLDSEDKTTFTPAVQVEQESLAKVAALDGFLETNSQSESNLNSTSEKNSLWNSVPESAVTPAGNTMGIENSINPDPLAAFSNNGNRENSLANNFGDLSGNQSSASLDPMSHWDQPQTQSVPSQWQDNDDDWWREGSQADDSPVLSQAISQERVAQSPAQTTEQPATDAIKETSTPIGGFENGTAHHAELAPIQSVQPTPVQTQASQPQPQPQSVQAQTAAAQLTPEHLLHSAQPNRSANETGATVPSDSVNQSNAGQSAPAAWESLAQTPPQSGLPQHPAGQDPMENSQAYAAQQPFTPPQVGSLQPPHMQSQVQAQQLAASGHQASHEAQVQTPQPSAQTEPSNFQQLAQALGLGELPAQQLQHLVPEASSIINETLNRLMDLLRARSSIKNELRVQRTMIQATDNNPLKFSASAQDALRIMFNPGNQAYLNPHMAVKDSFDDLSDHQVAVLAGMRAAYDAMLAHFKPENLDRRFNNSSSMLSNKKAKNWEAFEQHFASLTRDGEAAYDMLFGEEFASTYERQLSELKNARSLTSR